MAEKQLSAGTAAIAELLQPYRYRTVVFWLVEKAETAAVVHTIQTLAEAAGPPGQKPEEVEAAVLAIRNIEQEKAGPHLEEMLETTRTIHPPEAEEMEALAAVVVAAAAPPEKQATMGRVVEMADLESS